MTRIEIWKLPSQDTLNIIIQFCFKVIEENAQKKESIEDLILYKHELFIKFTYTLNTISKLYKGYTIEYSEKSREVIDYCSIIVFD